MSSRQKITNVIARVLLFVLGVAFILFGIADVLVPHARFVDSNPPAAAIVAEPPSAVIVTFSNKLTPESTMDVTSTVRLLPSGELDYLDGSSVVMESGIDPTDLICGIGVICGQSLVNRVW